jgi:hypothetical protein
MADLCVLDKTFGDAKSWWEIDAMHRADGQPRQLQFGNCLRCHERRETPEAGAWRPGELRFVRYTDLVRDTLSLVGRLPQDVTAVAGIPRSGMLPATMLATSLHVPLYSLHKDEGLRAVGAGSRERLLPGAGGTLLVVDDSVYHGTAIRWARHQLTGHNAIFAAVYTRRPKATELHAVELSSPHLCEWNCFNNPIVSGSAADKRLRGGIAFDFDGVLCENPTAGYKPTEWLPHAVPLPWIPRGMQHKLLYPAPVRRKPRLRGGPPSL